MITFVTYYFEFPEQMIKKLDELFYNFDQQFQIPPKETAQYIEAMFESVKQYHPNARCLLLTDENTKIKLPSFVEVVRIHHQSNYMQFEMFHAYIRSFEVISPDSHVISLDPDMIVQENLEHIFDKEGDLFLTFQKENSKTIPLKEQNEIIFPVNIGFVGIRNVKKEGAKCFFQSALKECFKFKEEKYYYWYGMQLILKNYFREHLLLLQEQGCNAVPPYAFGDLKIAFLDAEYYNYAPNETCVIPLDTKVIHFKGRSKKFMLPYWKTIKNDS